MIKIITEQTGKHLDAGSFWAFLKNIHFYTEFTHSLKIALIVLKDQCFGNWKLYYHTSYAWPYFLILIKWNEHKPKSIFPIRIIIQRCIRIRFAQQSIINSNVCSQYHSTWEKYTNQFWLLTRFWFLFKHLQTFRKILPLWNDKNNTDWRIKIPHRHLSTPHQTMDEHPYL